MAVSQAEADTPVMLELVLALDSSASVDRQEFQLQLDGLSAAFADPDVLAQVETLKPFGAAIAVVQWGAPGETRLVLPFTLIASSRDAKAFGFQVSLIRRWMHASSTSIASGIEDSRILLESNEYQGLRKIIDVSGDGMDNSGADLKGARQRAIAAGITVNGLPIMADDSTLDIYYRERVIIGAASFIEPASDFRDYVRAIKQKLLRELRPLQS
ncbi:MAG: DUF1194 domain-containing protein [Rhizobiales bacterium]|nr:DUF1194 domain-containing protein [Hyphomicrobiales bacterium]